MKRIVIFNKDRGANNSLDIIEVVRMWMSTVRNGNYVIEMKKSEERRSISQNRLMWVWFSAIADAWSEATGSVFTRNDVHDAYCQMFLPIDTPKGRVGGSTSGLSTEEMSEFMDRVHADASDDGIVLLNPEDRMYEQWASQYE